MQSKFFKRTLSVVLALALVAALATGTILTRPRAIAAGGKSNVSYTKVGNNGSGLFFATKEAVKDFEAAYVKDGKVRVSIVLSDASVLAKGYSTKNIAANTEAVNYGKSLRAKQDALAAEISDKVLGGEALDVVWNITMSGNIISANVPVDKIDAIRNIMGVKKVVVETIYEPASDLIGDEVNMVTAAKMTGTPNLWAEGYTGLGSKVAIIDTGLDIYHELFDEEAFEFAVEESGKQVDLLTADDIEEVLDQLHIVTDGRIANLTAEDLYISSKIPFGANYVDNDLNVEHIYDVQGEHGSHVTGIAAGNRYVPDGEGGFVSSLEAVETQGQAPDAQIIVMKVFGAGGGAYDSDYVVAIEDAITLGADSVNLSLGSAVAGLATDDIYQTMYDSFTESDTVVVISSGNNSYWAEQTTFGDLYSDDVNYATNGSPGSYASALTIASVDNNEDHKYFVVDDYAALLYENIGFGNRPYKTLAGIQEYVLIDGIGTPEQFASIADEVEGKIAICSRGQSTFSEKVNAAAAAGAIGVLIYNNQSGTILMNLSDIKTTIPAASITQEAGAALKELAAESYETEDGLSYYVGSLEICTEENNDPAKMSSFSSWGVPGDLTLKPELSAPGGSIYSVNGDHIEQTQTGYSLIQGHNNYESMSGTSMAAPQVTGLAALFGQYIRENGLDEKYDISPRKLMNSLLMSTAEPLFDAEGYYYSVFQQGAGLADVYAATSAKGYITIDEVAETAPLSAAQSIADGKVKVELGAITDDSFDVTFSIHNISGEDVEYYLSADFFTQYIAEYFRNTDTDFFYPYLDWTVDGTEFIAIDPNMYDFNGDGVVNSLDAHRILEYLVDPEADLNGLDFFADFDGDEDIDSYDARLAYEELAGTALVVEADQTVQIVLTVSGLEEEFGIYAEYGLVGNYIEGYIYAREGDSEDGALGTAHSIPVFGFWGDWSESSMYDRVSYEDVLNDEIYYYPYMYYRTGNVDAQNQIIEDEDTFYRQVFLVNYPGVKGAYYLGGNPLVSDEIYMPDRNAINSDTVIKSALHTLIRNAGATRFFVTNKYGKTVAQVLLGPEYAAYYHPNTGVWRNVSTNTAINYIARTFKEGDSFTINFQAIPEYYIDAEGTPHWEDVDADATTFSLPLVLDNEVPFIVGAVYDEDTSELVISAHDNQYISSVVIYTEEGDFVDYYGSIDEIRKGEQYDYLFDLGEAFGDEIEPHLLVEVYDYALNLSTYKINLNAEEELTDPELSVVIDPKEATIINKGSAQLSASVYPWGFEDETVYWESLNEDVAVVDENGLVTSVYEGEGIATATIVARSAVDEEVYDTAEISVLIAHKDLNGIIWDETGKVWVTEFDIATVPQYKKLNDTSLNGAYSSMAYGTDGNLYAANLDTDTFTSTLFAVDPETWTLTAIGNGVGAGIMDMCPAYALDGNYMYAAYGANIIIVDLDTGSLAGYYSFEEDTGGANIVGITYEELYYNQRYGIYVDYVLFLDEEGVLYEVGICDLGTFPVFEIGEIGEPVDIPYWQSLYYDIEEDDIYWTRFNYDDNFVELIMVNDFYETGECLSIGAFADDVWPVGGLFELDPVEVEDDGNSTRHNDEAEITRSMLPASDFAKPAVRKADGELNALPALRPADGIQKTVTEVTVEIRAEELSQNGMITVEIPDTAELVSVTSKAQYTAECYDYPEVVGREGAVVEEAGYWYYRFAFVDMEGIEEGDAILTLKFAMGSTGTLVIYTEDINEDDEQLLVETVILGVASAEHNVHTYAAEWEWNTDDNGNPTATAYLNCTLDDGAPEIVLEAEITSEVTDNSVIYTATVELDGKEFTDTLEIGIARISGRSANFGSELGVNFLLKISDAITEDEDAYAVVTFNGEDYEYLLADCVNGNQYKITKSFAVKQYADEMTLKLYTGEGVLIPLYDKDGNDVTDTGYSFSMLGYLNLVLENSTNEELIALAKAFHDYGLAAAIQFNYIGENDSADEFYNNLDEITLETLSDYAPVYNDKSLDTVTGDTATISYNSQLVLTKYFHFVKGTDVSAYKFYVDGVEVEAIKISETQYALKETGIPLKNLDDTYTFKVSDGENSYEVVYSALSYCYKALESGKATTEMENLAKATYIAYAAAEAYFG